MNDHLPLLAVAVLLAGAWAVMAVAYFSERLSQWSAAAALFASGVFLLRSVPKLLAGGPWHYQLGGWAPPWGIELVLTPFSCLFACLILAAAAGSFYFAVRPGSPFADGAARFFPSLHLLLTGALLGLLFSRDAFTLYLFLELSLIAAAGILGMANEKGWLDAFHLLLYGSACASLFLLGVIFLFAVTGTLHLDDLLAQLFISKGYSMALTAGLLLTAAWTVHFLFPVPTFFTRALDQTPSLVLGFFAAGMTRVGAYVLFLFLFFVLNVPGTVQPLWLVGLEYGLAALFLSGFVSASRQKDFQHTVAFLSAAQLGYLFLGFILGNKSALTGALMELLSQVLVVAGLFFIAGSLKAQPGSHPLSRMMGLARQRPFTGLAMVVFTSSIVGVPPTGGFFGKFYLLQGAVEKKDWAAVVLVAVTVVFNFIYFAKLIGHLYEHRTPSLAYAPATAASKAPIILLAVGVLFLGLFNQRIIHDFIEPALPKAFLNVPVPTVPFLGKQVE